MIKFFSVIFLFLTLGCSFNQNSKIWNQKDQKSYDKQKVKKIFQDQKKIIKEFNPFLRLEISNKILGDKKKGYTNNFGSLKYSGKLDKKNSFKFNKFKKTYKLDSKPIFLENGLVFFDNKGTIIRYNFDKKVEWKQNIYKRSEKKLNPNINFSRTNKNLIIADNLSKIYSLDLKTGEVIWSKYNTYPINSDIKTFGDKFYLVDFNNTLKCFNIKDGSECWNVQTEKSFTISNKKNSIILVNNNVIFSNSIGDITAVDILSGSIIWQLPTQNSKIINKTYDFEISNLVSDGKSIFFSNNKNQFYSVDLKTGTPNWINNISSSLTPILIDNLIFTTSNEGFLFVIQRKQGNIIRINYLYKNLKLKERNNTFPIGHKVGDKNLYLTSNNNVLDKIELETGIILESRKLSGSILSEPFIYNENLYIIKNNSITQFE